ncbi:MAG TPA: HU family DNA-binding protein [Candidatus Acidoferrum sp.]|jgi:DNA-binding protein HU-beta|nr:HU family DNA-binding protein [Candidatus Acidoferrum sp.]
MTKNELARELAEEMEVPRRQVVDLIEAMLEKITDVLKSGDKVQLTPFGQFKVRDRAARIARNPKTGEPIKVPAKRVLKFIAGRTLKEAVGTAKRGSGAAKKSSAKKSTAKKSTAKKAPARKAPARKTAAKKTTRKKGR